MLEEKDVEFYFMIGYVLVIVSPLWMVNELCKANHVSKHQPP